MALDIDYGGLWHRAQKVNLDGHTFLTLAPEDDLLLLAIHGGKEMWWKLKWVQDIAAFVASHPDLDWSAVAERARAQGCLRMLLLATSLAREYFSATVPNGIVAAELNDRAIEPMVRRIVERWQTDEPGASPDNKSVSMERLQLHDGIIRQVRYVARTMLLPSPRHVVSVCLPPDLEFAYIPIKLTHDLLALPIWKALRHALAPLQRLPLCVCGVRYSARRHALLGRHQAEDEALSASRERCKTRPVAGPGRSCGVEGPRRRLIGAAAP